MGKRVSWRVVAASAAGTLHADAGEGCQDSCLAQVERTFDQRPVLTIFVADGAGSTARGGAGAELAIEAAAAFVANDVASPEFELNDQFAAACAIAVRERICTRAEDDGLLARDYACTFLGVISTDNQTLVVQIGDGAIVLDAGNGLEVPIAPMAGEYCNMTRFITDDDAIAFLATRVYPAKALKVAAFTDGIQRLALNLAANTAHAPFFAPLFAALESAAPEHEDRLQSALAAFLGSTSVNARTDDDKTLALAVSVD